MDKNKVATLSEEVAKEYDLKIIHPGVTILPKRFGGKTVDFRSMKLEEAKKLAAIEGFPYLVKKGSAQAAEKAVGGK